MLEMKEIVVSIEDCWNRRSVLNKNKKAWDYFLNECRGSLDLFVMSVSAGHVSKQIEQSVIDELNHQLEPSWLEKLMISLFPSLYPEYSL
jgi:hypothetical protein